MWNYLLGFVLGVCATLLALDHLNFATYFALSSGASLLVVVAESVWKKIAAP